MTYQDKVVSVLEKLALIGKIRRQNRFRNKAFANAAKIIDTFQGNFEKLYYSGEIKKLPGIGKGSAAIIDAVMHGKTIEDLVPDFPSELIELAALPSIGLKRAKLLYYTLGVKNLSELKDAIKNDKLLQLSGIGSVTQQRIAQSLERHHERMGKLRLDQALVLAHMICNKITRHFSKHTPIIVGDLRRGHDLVDSIEILIYPSLSLNKIKTFLGLINTGEITLEKGPIRGCSGINHEQITIKIFSASKIHTGISQILLTGSNKFIEKIIKYSNKDIKELSSIESPSEEGAFKALGLTYIPAELRESHTNLIKLKKHVPVLIQLNDICGTFHNHTLASDGKNTIFEMRQAAINFGLKYISINDHSQSAFYAGGQHPDKLLEQIKEINILNKDSCASACFLLSGVESDIHLNGDLDYENNILEKLDIVVASVHNKLQLNYDDMTQRMVKAASQVYTNIIGHPTGRLLLIREPSTYDLEKLFEACKNNDVAVELNCQPARLDLCDRYLQIAKAYGVMVSINPDAHTIRGFEFLKNGIIIARRAGLTAYDVINTRSLHEIKEWIVKRTKKKK